MHDGTSILVIGGWDHNGIYPLHNCGSRKLNSLASCGAAIDTDQIAVQIVHATFEEKIL